MCFGIIDLQKTRRSDQSVLLILQTNGVLSRDTECGSEGGGKGREGKGRGEKKGHGAGLADSSESYGAPKGIRRSSSATRLLS